MSHSMPTHLGRLSALLALSATAMSVQAAPVVSRLTPPSELFSSGNAAPVIARFLPGQRFDLQATVQPDAGRTITDVRFFVDNIEVTSGTVAFTTSGLVAGLAAGTTVASLRAYADSSPGVHLLKVRATQSDNQVVEATGNFEVVPVTQSGRRAKNVIILLGDGMGAAHRTAARIVLNGYSQGKVRAPLAMDTFSNTAMVMTASLNSIITDSSPGMASYVTGNKSQNNQEGVFPDDTVSPFDNPRVEYLGQYMHRLYGKSLGIVTTADVFDATPAANAVYTADRGAGTGIVDQYFDDRDLTGLKVLLGGGRKWFVPNPSNSVSPQPPNGSQRRSANDYVLTPDITTAWGSAPGALDPGRDLIGDFVSAGWTYAPDASTLSTIGAGTDRLLGLFSWSNMNVAFDKIGKRRGTSTLVDDFGFPDQPMLDEMAAKALQVLNRSPQGFVLMIEAASIDKQAHNMDSDRWIVDTIEFDRAIKVAQEFANSNPDTLVIITADHECSGAAIIGASQVTNAELVARSTAGLGTAAGGLRSGVVGIYDAAGFPRYTIGADGYPQTTDPDRKLLIGYGANADRYEDWLANAQPLQDTQQPFNGAAPLNTHPANPLLQDQAGGLRVTGQVDGTTAVHTASDIPLSAYGRGAALFNGVIDNTDVFFKIGQAVIGGAK